MFLLRVELRFSGLRRYRVERLQYMDLLSSYSGVRMSQLYGPEHLLRLLVKLPDVPDVVKNMGADQILIFNSHLHSLARYLVRRAGELFGGVNYEVREAKQSAPFSLTLFDQESSTRVSEAVILPVTMKSMTIINYNMKY